LKFKIDENLPIEITDLLCADTHDAMTVTEQGLGGEPDRRIAEVCQGEGRTLVTLDLDFANMRAYPPRLFPGLIVLRLRRQDKPHVLTVMRRVVPLLRQEHVQGRLWIVEEDRIRIRGEDDF
jgi:predicted nuclease of predicted toxin-antitoxin system